MAGIDPFDPRYKIAENQNPHGVDMDALRDKLEKLHAIPQLKAGINGKLSVVKAEAEARPMTEAERQEAKVKALAQCVALAEGNWIDRTIKSIFRQDGIGMSYNKRIKMMREGNVKPMADMLGELEIRIDRLPPPDDYDMPELVVLFRHLQITKGGKVRGEMIWEWSREA